MKRSGYENIDIHTEWVVVMARFNLDYFYGIESQQYAFFRIPKLLMTDERYKNLSSDAKILYGLLLDRMYLSIENGWIDDEDRVYIIYTNSEMQAEIGCSDKTATNASKALKDIGLIDVKRRGQGKPSIIYVKNFATNLESENLRIKNRKNYDSRVGETTSLESENLRTNNTNKNKTNGINNKYINYIGENASSEDILPVQVVENVGQYDFFAQPTFEQVCKYAESRKIQLNEYQLVDFFNYYERLGWTTQDQVTRAKSPCHWGRKLLNWETKNLELRNAIHQQNEIAEERLNNQEPNCVDAPKTKKTQEVGTIHFNIPSRSQVETFIKDNKLLDVDAKAFLAYYDERHWVDAGGKRITNWQDKCKKWQKRHNERQLTKTVEKVVLPELSHPTIEDIRKYVKDNKLKFVEPERFFRYYENKAWSGVQNWKNVLESWDSKGKDRAEAQTKQAQASDSWQKKKTQEKNLQQAELLENTLYLIRDEKEKENALLEIKRLRAEA